MKIQTFSQLQSYMPERIIEKAVKGMLPKGSLGRSLFRKLKVYAKDEHPHIAQQPILIL
jgi:large subunit ribosomal protein L13